MSRQMIGNKVVNALSQILVGRLESNSKEIGLKDCISGWLSSRGPGWYSWEPRRTPPVLCRRSRSRSLVAMAAP